MNLKLILKLIFSLFSSSPCLHEPPGRNRTTSTTSGNHQKCAVKTCEILADTPALTSWLSQAKVWSI